MGDTTDNEHFKSYFHMRADVAEDLHKAGWTVDANIVATTALDALAEVWLHDFPGQSKTIQKLLGGAVPPSIRMARLVKRFAADAPHSDKVAVLMFAEDWKKNVPAATADADALLAPRIPKHRGELPHAHLDVSREELFQECPAIPHQPLLAALVEEYEYPALAYRFLRSPFVHYGTTSDRTHGFTRGIEVFYMPLKKGTTIGISLGVVTGWLRAAATNYVSLLHGTRSPSRDRPRFRAAGGRNSDVQMAAGCRC